ncbi:MAG: hypothetical protein Q9222_006664 [Ikaeria aurantiellina]
MEVKDIMKGYKKACDSLRSCPLTLTHPSEAQALTGFGPKICERLEQRLKQHCEENGLPMPKRKGRKRQSGDLEESALDATPAKKPRKSKKPYVPQLRSGAYALLLGLGSVDESECVSKQQLIELAQPHCDASFTATRDTTTFYTAWNSMKTLVDKDLVKETSRPQRRYALTDEGWEVADKMKKAGKGDNGTRESSLQPTTTQGLRDPTPGLRHGASKERLPLANIRDLNAVSNTSSSLKHRPDDDKYSGTSSTKDVSGKGTAAGRNDSRHPVPLYKRGDSLVDAATDQLDFVELLSSSPPLAPSLNPYRQPTAEPKSNLPSAQRMSEPPHETSLQLGRPSTTTFPPFQPIILQPGTFTIELILDNREIRSREDRSYIEKTLITQGIRPQVRALPLGDFFWVARTTSPHLLSQYGEEGQEIALDYIIERKRLDDLISSIKDGRFHEQKFRLRKSGVRNAVYLIEDIAISQDVKSRYWEAVNTAIAGTQVVNGFFVKRTRGIDDTIRYLVRMTRMIREVYER